MAQLEFKTVKAFCERLDEMAGLLEVELGVEFRRTHGSAGRNSYDVSFRLTPAEDEDQFVDDLDTAEARAFCRVAELCRLSPDDLGRTFTHNGKSYRLIGYDAKRPRPFILKDEHGVLRDGGATIIPSVISARPGS